MTSEVMVAALGLRARHRAAELQHRLGDWKSAKHKFGKASKSSWCLNCGSLAVVKPYGSQNVPKFISDCPAIGGPALSMTCPTPLIGPLEQPKGQSTHTV